MFYGSRKLVSASHSHQQNKTKQNFSCIENPANPFYTNTGVLTYFAWLDFFSGWCLSDIFLLLVFSHLLGWDIIHVYQSS